MKRLVTILLMGLCGMSIAAPVRTMVGARNIALQDTKQVSPYPIPDNAVEIEYIETTGRTSNANYGQHIVLPLLGDSPYIIEMDVELLPHTTRINDDICSIQVSTTDRAIYLRINPFQMLYTIASSTSIRNISITNTLYARHLFKTVADPINKEMRLYCDDEMLLTCPALPWSARNLFLFANNRGQGNNSSNGAKCKCWGVKAWNSSTNKLVMDLVPIKIDDVGYMFDRCTGEVLGNSGVGSFIIGPDKQ